MEEKINKEMETKEGMILVMFDVIVRLKELADYLYYNKDKQIETERTIEKIEFIHDIIKDMITLLNKKLELDNKDILGRLNYVKQKIKEANSSLNIFSAYLELEILIIKLSNSFARYITTKLTN